MKTARRLRRFYSASPLPGAGGTTRLSAKETHHLKNILRLKVGDSCLVTDGTGKEAEARVSDFAKDGTTKLQIETPHRIEDSGKVCAPLILCAGVALPQKGKMDDLMAKAQELGLDSLCPLETEHTVVKMSAENKGKALRRWQKITAESAKQSGSLKLIDISTPWSFEGAVTEIPHGDLVAIFHPAKDAVPFREWIQTLEGIYHSSGATLHLFFGPEGGFSEKEIRQVVETRKFLGASIPTLVSLGKNILKIDTAFLGVLSALRFLFP